MKIMNQLDKDDIITIIATYFDCDPDDVELNTVWLPENDGDHVTHKGSIVAIVMREGKLT